MIFLGHVCTTFFLDCFEVMVDVINKSPKYRSSLRFSQLRWWSMGTSRKSYRLLLKTSKNRTNGTPKPEYLIALAIYLGVRWKGPILMETKVYTPTNVAESYATETLQAVEEVHLRFLNRVTMSLTFTTKSPTLRITGDPAKKRGLDVFFAGFWDLQTTSFEIPWFLGY